MSEIDVVMTANREAVNALIAAAEASGNSWTTPRAPGKWSPSQVVEHVAMALEEAANAVDGAPSKVPSVPAFLRPLLRGFFFNRIVAKRVFPKAKTNAALNPASGPATPAEARPRLAAAMDRFDRACHARAGGDGLVPSTAFGNVSVTDYAVFMELHTLHHVKQMPGGG